MYKIYIYVRIYEKPVSYINYIMNKGASCASPRDGLKTVRPLLD